jgi:hypothetical protein
MSSRHLILLLILLSINLVTVLVCTVVLLKWHAMKASE